MGLRETIDRMMHVTIYVMYDEESDGYAANPRWRMIVSVRVRVCEAEEWSMRAQE